MNSRKRLTAIFSLVALAILLAGQPDVTAVPRIGHGAGTTTAGMTAVSPVLSPGWLPSVLSVRAPSPGFSYVGMDDLPDHAARPAPGSCAGRLTARKLSSAGLGNFAVLLRTAVLLFPFHDFW